VWVRRGFALLWDADTLAELASPSEVVSIRGFFELVKDWPEDLPSGDGNTLVVAGLEGCIDVLTPDDAEVWIEQDLRPQILNFQEEYEGQAGLVFWLPSGRQRIYNTHATGSYFWRCAPPCKDQSLALGRILWAGAEVDAGHILNPQVTNQDYDGPAWIGLHHPRIS
jgi:hypothetical protein